MPHTLVDQNASPRTRDLFAWLMNLQGQGIMFGHQHDLTYGYTFDVPDGSSSDTFAAVGDYPAVFGWDTLILDGHERPGSPDASRAENEQAFIRMLQRADALGGINTISAHVYNFVTGNDFYDVTGDVVRQILPGGDRHADFTELLDSIARVAHGSVDADGQLIPIVFRPFHENNGRWFWWGPTETAPEDYIAVFRFTVEYLRDECGVRNFLYSYSPNGSFDGDPEPYLLTWPGDAYVDILGLDQYDPTAASDEWLETLLMDLRMVIDLADERGKMAAYTEFGEQEEENRNPSWFTDVLTAIADDSVACRATWMLTWANFGPESRAYVPAPATDDRPEDVLLPDFRAYAEHPYSLFASDLSGRSEPGAVRLPRTRQRP